MKKLELVCILIVLVLFTLCACSQEDHGCTPPPSGFSPQDLVGTWYAGTPDHYEKLIIRGDGSYKQIIHIDFAEVGPEGDIDFESDWLYWWLEYDLNGWLYLYLDEMRLCGAFPDLYNCDQIGGGEEDWYAFNQNHFYDYCKEESVLMQNGGILIVQFVEAIDSSPPYRIYFQLLQITPENAWRYRKIE